MTLLLLAVVMVGGFATGLIASALGGAWTLFLVSATCVAVVAGMGPMLGLGALFAGYFAAASMAGASALGVARFITGVRTC